MLRKYIHHLYYYKPVAYMLTALDLFVFVFNIYVSSIKELKNFMCVLGLLLNNNNKKGS